MKESIPPEPKRSKLAEWLAHPPKVKKQPLESHRLAGGRTGKSDKLYFKGILFDLDGTLIDSTQDIGAAANHVRTEKGFPSLPLETIKGFIGDGVWMLLSKSLNTEDPVILEEAIQIWRSWYKLHCLDHTVLYPGVLQLLKELTEDKVSLAVVSNKPVAFCEQILEGLKIRSYFGSVVGGDSTQERKPHPEPMRLAAQQLHIEGNHLLAVGDSSNDILSGRDAGFKTCGVLWGIGLERQIRDVNPDYIIHVPMDVTRVIRTVFSG